MNATAPSLQAPAADQVCVLVLGMHRSGTSAMTRVLNLHGVALGENLLAPAADNAKGFWEKQAVVQMHERLLAALGRTWRDPRPLPAGWLETEAAAQAASEIGGILDEFAGAPLFAIKDPRLCELVELWLPVLRERGIRPVVLFVARHPLEVAESIHVRDGWTRDLSWLVWSRSTIEALAASTGVDRCVVTYEHLLEDWRSAMAKAGTQLQVQWPIDSDQAAAGVQEFLDLGERHHRSTEHADSEVPQHLLDIYASLRAVEDGASWNILDSYAELNEDFRMSTVALHEEAARPDTQEGSRTRSGGLVQIFYRKGTEVHAETRSRTLTWPDATNVASFAFRFHEPIEIDALRIDFDDAPGVFLLDRLEIDGEPVEVPPLVTSYHGTLLGDGVASTVGLVAADNDPWVEISLAETRCRVVSVSITRIPLNDAVHSMRSFVDVHQRLGMLFQRVASSGDCILANQRAAHDRVTRLAQETTMAVHGQAEAVSRLEQRLLQSDEATSRLDGSIDAASRKLDAIVETLASQALAMQASTTGALNELASQQRLLVEQAVAQAQANSDGTNASLLQLNGNLAQVAEAQARANAGLDERLAHALDALRRLESGQALAMDGLQGLEERVSTVLGKLDALSSALARQHDELDAVAAHAQQQGRELVVMAGVLEEVNRSRLGWRLRKLFGLNTSVKDT